jgi:ribonucleoside-diphosphate reductase beta chain
VFDYDGTFESRLERARTDLTPDYFTLFDGYLVDAHQALLSDPSDIEAKVDFVTIYHMVIEGMLALTGQYFQTDNLEQRGILPGHLKAFNLISRDEHRHVAWGTWFLQQKARDPELAQRIQDRLVETLPPAAGVLVPPGFQLGDDYEYLGYSSQELNEFAFTALSRRLKVIGVGLPAIAA